MIPLGPGFKQTGTLFSSCTSVGTCFHQEKIELQTPWLEIYAFIVSCFLNNGKIDTLGLCTKTSESKPPIEVSHVALMRSLDMWLKVWVAKIRAGVVAGVVTLTFE